MSATSHLPRSSRRPRVAVAAACALLLAAAALSGGGAAAATPPAATPHAATPHAATPPAATPHAATANADDPGVYTAYDGGGQILNITPPGSAGNVDAAQLAAVGTSRTATGTTPTNFADQLETYDAINKRDPASLGDGDLSTYFKDASLGITAAQTVSTETPRAGTVIKRDAAGVPHIFGDTYDDTTYGAGYANVEDRMFLTDVLRNTAEATTVSFLGYSAGNLSSDQHQLQVSPYTHQQLIDQLATSVTRYGAEGTKMVAAVDAYVAGMNAAVDALCPVSAPTTVGAVGAGAGPNCPVEYAALQRSPQHYDRGDVVAIASLIAGRLGFGGGSELANATWYQSLVTAYGPAKAKTTYDDLRERNDPEAPVTTTSSFPLGLESLQPRLPGVVLPDATGPTAPGTGSDAGGSSLPGGLPVPAIAPAGSDPLHAADPTLTTPDGPLPLAAIGLALTHRGLSNALLVDGAHSTSGHPVVVFGPQTGYYAPQLLVEEDLEGPGIHARGVSFAGTGFIVELGHSIDYAWSATSADNDNVDVVADTLCNADGSAATVTSTSYIGADGSCTAMVQFTDSETSYPGATSQTAPTTVNLLALLTRHGSVQLRATVGGVPTAFSRDRSTFGHELDSAVGFQRIDDPAEINGPADFAHAFSAVDYTFNWFYVDNSHISYYNAALIPLRSPLVDPDLPRRGTPTYDDTGFASTAQHPQSTDPAEGYLVSWNNKQAANFPAADNIWADGPVYRSVELSDRVKALVANGGKTTRGALTGVMMQAATEDLRAEYVLPYVLDVIATGGAPTDAQDAEAVKLLSTWVADGGHRVDRARTGAYDHPQAVALLDAWWDSAAAGDGGTASLPKDAMRGGLGALTDSLPQETDDHPRNSIGSSWNGVAWYNYLNKDLRQVLGKPVLGSYSRGYCGAGVLTQCRSDLLASLHAAVQDVLTTQQQTSVDALTFDKTSDDIKSVTAGLVGVRNIDWQNRPTFQQVASFTAHRPLPAVAPAPVLASPSFPAVVVPAPVRSAAPRPKPTPRPRPTVLRGLGALQGAAPVLVKPTTRRTLAFTGPPRDLDLLAGLLLLAGGLTAGAARRRRPGRHIDDARP